MKIGIVMPCINLWEQYTRNAIASVDVAMLAAKGHNIETHFLLIDNASTDNTQDEAQKRVSSLFTYQRNGERWGFQRSVNFGVNFFLEKGFDAVLVLNNDVLIHSQSIWRLAERIGKGDVGMVTCLDVAGETSPQGLESLDPRDKMAVDEAPHPHFSAFCVTKECWEEAGEFDEVFHPAYFEDNDYHHRMNRLEIPAVVYPPAMFYHFGSRTQNEASEDKMPIVSSPMFENARAFYFKKWGGIPGEEKFETPYNDPKRTLRYTLQRPDKVAE